MFKKSYKGRRIKLAAKKSLAVPVAIVTSFIVILAVSLSTLINKGLVNAFSDSVTPAPSTASTTSESTADLVKSTEISSSKENKANKEKVEEIKSLGIDVGEGKVEFEKMYEEDWANNWKKYYKPSKVGEKIVVKPIWEEYEAKDEELVVELDPGMAFGTGELETTRMCIQALEKYVQKDSTVFDVGCGSGILAIAAAKLGAKLAVGVDLDPVAVE